MNRPLAMLAVATSLVSACTTISGLDADFELAPARVVDASEDGSAPAMDASSSDATVVPPKTDEAGCSDACPISCQAIKAADASSTSGIYVIQGASGSLSVYCDMEMDSGGWTLIGRSTPPDVGVHGAPFGWHSESGAPDDDSKPYSLGVQRLAFTPKAMLFGTNGTGKNWGANVYRANLPSDFLTARTSSATAITPLVAVKGDCQTGGAMHSHAGYTSRTDVFFFRDNDADDYVFGLFDDRWYLNVGTSCAYVGELNGFQGMIFVR